MQSIIKGITVISIGTLIGATSVQATDASALPSASLRPRQEIRQELRQEIKEDRAQIRSERQQLKSDVAAVHAANLERKFNFMYTRFTNILNRFQKRLDVLKTAGKDVSSIQSELDAAKLKLSEAKAKGDAAVAAFKAIDPAKFSEQKTQAFAARDQAIAARKLFADTLELLKQAMKTLKSVSKPALPAASAAVQNSVTGGSQ